MGEAVERYSVFLGGPIQHAIREGTFLASLAEVIERLASGISQAGFELMSAHLLEEFGAQTAQWTAERIARRDWRWMQAADVFVAVLPPGAGGTQVLRTDGTHIELGWASALGKPIVLIQAQALTNEYSHLVRGLGEITRVVSLEFDHVASEPDLLVRTLCDVLEPSADTELSPPPSLIGEERV